MVARALSYSWQAKSRLWAVGSLLSGTLRPVLRRDAPPSRLAHRFVELRLDNGQHAFRCTVGAGIDVGLVGHFHQLDAVVVAGCANQLDLDAAAADGLERQRDMAEAFRRVALKYFLPIDADPHRIAALAPPGQLECASVRVAGRAS